MREVAPAEYDDALRAAPAACPLLAVAGDARPGAALLVDLDSDRLLDEARGPAAVDTAGWADRLHRLAAGPAGWPGWAWGGDSEGAARPSPIPPFKL